MEAMRENVQPPVLKTKYSEQNRRYILLPRFRLKLVTLSRVCICLKVDQFLAKTLLAESLTDILGICFALFFVSLVEAKAEGLKGGEHLVSSSVKPVFRYLF